MLHMRLQHIYSHHQVGPDIQCVSVSLRAHIPTLTLTQLHLLVNRCLILKFLLPFLYHFPPSPHPLHCVTVTLHVGGWDKTDKCNYQSGLVPQCAHPLMQGAKDLQLRGSDCRSISSLRSLIRVPRWTLMTFVLRVGLSLNPV